MSFVEYHPPKKCNSPKHNPPNKVLTTPGIHVWECPECHERQEVCIGEVAASLLREYRTRKYIAREIGISYERFIYFAKHCGTYRGVPMPTKYKRRSWRVHYDKKQADEFIAGVKKFESEYMDIIEVSEKLGVSLQTLYKSTKTGLVFGVPLKRSKRIDKKNWWKRSDVDEWSEKIQVVDEVREFKKG